MPSAVIKYIAKNQFVSGVRDKRSIEASMSSADLVHRKGVGLALSLVGAEAAEPAIEGRRRQSKRGTLFVKAIYDRPRQVARHKPIAYTAPRNGVVQTKTAPGRETAMTVHQNLVGGELKEKSIHITIEPWK